MSSKVFYSFLFGLLFSLSANATTCSKSYTLGFFNGVWNTEYESFDGTQALRNLIGDTYNNEPIHYESFYNHTGSSVGATALQDLAETFIQRSAEIDASGELGKRFEYFWEFIGSSEPTFIDKIKGIFSNAISLFESLYTAVNTKLVAIISYFTSNPPTEADYTTHNAQLDALAADGQKLMLVGHSQGNLFMNHGYDHILPTVGADRVAAAHIAPASPTLRGDWVLANIDLVINILRVQGLTSVPNNNLDINASRVDVSGHTLIGTYLDGTREGRAKVKTMIETGMGKLNYCLIYKGIGQFQISKEVYPHESGYLQAMKVHRSLVGIGASRVESYDFGSGINAYNNAQTFYLSLPLDASMIQNYINNYNIFHDTDYFYSIVNCETSNLDRLYNNDNLFFLRRQDIVCRFNYYNILKRH